MLHHPYERGVVDTWWSTIILYSQDYSNKRIEQTLAFDRALVLPLLKKIE